MWLEVETKQFTKLSNLKFDPYTDVTGSEVPINELSVDVITTQEIDTGGFCRLYDDRGNLWAKYWLVYADRMDENTVQVKAQSSLKLLERRMLDPVMLSNAPVADVVADIFAELGADSYVLDSSFAEKTLSGACPKQSCKTRLQWVCFVLGAYIKSFFSEKIEILPIQEMSNLIPVSQTYWKPELVYGEHVTRVHCTYYSFELGDPSTTDAWFSDGTNTYIQHAYSTSLANPDVPAGTLTHDEYYEGITLVNEDNVDEILSNLSRILFKRVSVSLDAVDNGEFIPGDRVLAYTDTGEMVEGFVRQASFTFGNQAKARLSLIPVDLVEVAPLLIIYQMDEATIDRANFAFPVGYPFEVENPYFDQMWIGVRYIFRPLEPYASGVLTQVGTVITEEYAVALAEEDHTLYIASVDNYEFENGTVTIT